MSIFFPDNDNRRNRLIELSSDSQSFLSDAKNSYKEFTDLNAEVNAKIVAVYNKAGLTPPPVSNLDILQAQKSVYDIQTGDTVVEVSNIVLGIGGLVATISYFAPAATALLVDAGVLGAETASAVLFSVLGAEVTVGALAGGIIGGLVVGIIVVGIGLAIDAFEGYELRDELRKGIYHADQIRATIKFSLDKSKTLVDFLKSVKTTCDSLLQSSIPLTDQIIQNLIEKNAIPALKAIDSITKESVLSELQDLDRSRNSWTNEDADGSNIVLQKSRPIYINAGVEVPESLCPAIPSGLKLTALRDPNNLDVKPNYPILKVGNVQYWPFSYIDNRDGMAIVAFDGGGNIIERWDKLGARYVWRIEEDLDGNTIAFIGQSEQRIVMNWSELTDLVFDAGVKVSEHPCFIIPEDLKLASLRDKDVLDPADKYTILLVGGIQYWPLSYIDNRNGMAILAIDGNGKIIKRFDKVGARYIWKIEEALTTRDISFIGQAGQRITIGLSELISLGESG
jgi:hypothetical protein